MQDRLLQEVLELPGQKAAASARCGRLTESDKGKFRLQSLEVVALKTVASFL